MPDPSSLEYMSQHSYMYWQGYWCGKDGKPCLPMYPPESEAWEDYVSGYSTARKEVLENWTPDL